MPSTVRPSVSVTRRRRRSLRTARRPGPATAPSCRDGGTRPRCTSAASASSPGSTRSRRGDERRPASRARWYADANSAPVTPDPTTISRSGSLVEAVQLLPGQDALAVGLALRQHPRVRAGRDAARRRPRAVSSPPSAAVATTTARPVRAGRRPRPAHALAPRRRPLMSADCAAASASTRALTAPRSTPTAVAVGSAAAAAQPHAELGRLGDGRSSPRRSRSASCSGTQSVSTAEPPSPSRSTTVTSAPSCAATSAASYPPGPPPRITTRSRAPSSHRRLAPRGSRALPCRAWPCTRRTAATSTRGRWPSSAPHSPPARHRLAGRAGG